MQIISSRILITYMYCIYSGELLEYTSTNMAEGLRTEDVSRIAYQLLSSVAHCEKHNILHRDIKPGECCCLSIYTYMYTYNMNCFILTFFYICSLQIRIHPSTIPVENIM